LIRSFSMSGPQPSLNCAARFRLDSFCPLRGENKG
jgi:hypothetical protein